MHVPAIVAALSRSILAGDPSAEEIRARCERTLGRNWPWLAALSTRYVEVFGNGTRASHRAVVQFLASDPGFLAACREHKTKIDVAEWLADLQRMQPVDAAQSWRLPVIESCGGLADWLWLAPNRLEWFADCKGLNRKLPSLKLQHYRYQIVSKPSGGIRLLESPKAELIDIQRRILSGILDRIPAHPAAHGFVKRRSIVTFAQAHTRKAAVLRMDIQDFFPSFPAARAQALFRTLGYPEQVADRLSGFCVNAAPARIWSNQPPGVDYRIWQNARIRYTRPHLPQGAPTSPSLANLMAYRLDCRLSGLARTAGAVYTRYADDLAFSGPHAFARAAERFSSHVAAVALEEGFSTNHHKTRIMRQGQSQQLAGVVVNQDVSLRRRDLDVLEAILTNCIRLGPESQNREARLDFRACLQGRISFVAMVSPAKGVRLKDLFDQIEWRRGHS